MTLVAIHQPNFFPWLGYFDKIARSDTFIFLDHVQYPKKGGSWLNRVKMFSGGEARWVTAPINRAYHGVARIDEVEWTEQPWRSKVIKTLESNYGRAPFFRETIDFFEPLIRNSDCSLASYNMESILAIAKVLDIPVDKIRCSSEFNLQENSNQLLIALTKAVEGDTYMCGGGSEGYQDDALFSTADVKLIYQEFDHPEYDQSSVGTFLPGLSIIDAFMSVGLGGVKSLLGIV